MADGDAVVLEQGGGSGLRVELSGGALPAEGVDVGVEHRLVRDRPPGAHEAVVQALGPDDLPMTLAGELNDHGLGDSGLAQERWETLARMCDEGTAVRLSWGTTWSRRVVIQEATATYRHGASIGYRLVLLTLQTDERTRGNAGQLTSQAEARQRAAALREDTIRLLALQEELREAS